MKTKEVKKQKRTRRSKVKYPALEKRYNLKSRADYNDIDYAHKLSDSEKDFLNRFLEETVNANFSHPGKPLIKDKKERKKIYDANNSRNRDVYNRKKTNQDLVFLGSDVILPTQDDFDENKIIEEIDKNLDAEYLINELNNLEDFED